MKNAENLWTILRGMLTPDQSLHPPWDTTRWGKVFAATQGLETMMN
jgi:hypothetical protein